MEDLPSLRGGVCKECVCERERDYLVKYVTMLIKEYRICLPLSVEEYRIAQLYMIQVGYPLTYITPPLTHPDPSMHCITLW